MIAYIINIGIKKTIEKDWIMWMKKEHIPEIMELKIFTKSEIWKIKNTDSKYNYYCIKYYTNSLDSYKLYKEKYAQKIQEKHSIKYKNQFNAKRKILQLAHEY